MLALHADAETAQTRTRVQQDLLLVEHLMQSMNLLKPAGPAIDHNDVLR